MKKIGKGIIAYGILLLLIVIFNILFWCSTSFTDFFVRNIFPFFLASYGRVTGWIPFSIGEWMLLAAVILTIIFILLCLILLISKIKEYFTHRRRSAKRFRAFIRGYQCFYAWMVALVGLIMTFNCVSLYHTTSLKEEIFDSTNTIEDEEMLRLWNHVVSNCNRLSGMVERDENGKVKLEGMGVSMEEEAIRCMQKLGERYDRLSGFYPSPKKLFFSDFMCQQNMQGYYFPFSLEANINEVMNPLRQPATFCHELSHLKGYLLEDEANFLAYLACTESDNTYFQYSGYLAILNYCSNEMNTLLREKPELLEKWNFVRINSLVDQDNYFVADEDWARINKNSWFSTETVKDTTRTILNSSLKINGVSDGIHSYRRVIEMLLRYYKTENYKN